MRTEFFSTIKQAYHTWSRNIEDKGYQQFYYAKKGQGLKAMSNMELSMSVKLGKTEIALLVFMALITYLSVTAPKSTVQEATPQPPRPTPTANSKIEILPSVSETVVLPETTTGINEPPNWYCVEITKAVPNAFRAALLAKNPNVVEPPDYLVKRKHGIAPEITSTLPHIVHIYPQGQELEEICVK